MYFSIDDDSLRLAGSMHVFPTGSPNIPRWLLDAYAWCTDLACEHDVTDPGSLVSHMQIPAGQTLRGRWPDPLVDQVEALASPLLGFKPWAVAMNIPSIIAGPMLQGVEQQLLPRAQAAGIPTSFLETGASLAAGLDRLPDSVSAAAAEYQFANASAVVPRMQNLHATWLTRNVDAVMAAATRGGLNHVPEFAKALIDERSRAWMPRFAGLAQPGRRTLVVVGALHLGGPQGLPSLLEAAGHRVRLL